MNCWYQALNMRGGGFVKGLAEVLISPPPARWSQDSQVKKLPFLEGQQAERGTPH